MNLPEILFKNIKMSGYYLQELKPMVNFQQVFDAAKTTIKCLGAFFFL